MIITLLQAAGADPNRARGPDTDMATAFGFVIYHEEWHIMRILIKEGGAVFKGLCCICILFARKYERY
jgi:hypothetical protein